MKLYPPSTSLLVKAFAIAIVLGAAAYGLFPFVGLQAFSPRVVFLVGTFAGALLGISVSGFTVAKREPQERPAAKRGEEGRKTVFVGNLAFKASASEVEALFAQYGKVNSVRIMTHRGTRRPRGFAFVEMPAADAERAIKALNGTEFLGRTLRVNEGSERV